MQNQAKKDTNSIAVVNGLEIKKNTLYKVINKPDPDAIQALVEIGSTKLPTEEAVNTVGMKFVSDGIDGGVYDTGLYTSSPCYMGRDSAEVELIVKSLQKNIVEPFIKLKGKAEDFTLTHHTNHTFWDDYLVSLWDGLVFNTAIPEQLFQLYVVVQSNQVTPENMIGNPAFTYSDFIIKDAANAVSFKATKIIEQTRAGAKLSTLIDTDFDLCIELLKSLDIIEVMSLPSQEDVYVIFRTWLEKDLNNARDFLKATENIVEDETKERIYITNAIKVLQRKKIIHKEKNSGYIFQNKDMGKTPKNVVDFLFRDENTEARDTILLQYHDLTKK